MERVKVVVFLNSLAMILKRITQNLKQSINHLALSDTQAMVNQEQPFFLMDVVQCNNTKIVAMKLIISLQENNKAIKYI